MAANEELLFRLFDAIQHDFSQLEDNELVKFFDLSDKLMDIVEKRFAQNRLTAREARLVISFLIQMQIGTLARLGICIGGDEDEID